jgi:HEAT repeat protein
VVVELVGRPPVKAARWVVLGVVVTAVAVAVIRRPPPPDQPPRRKPVAIAAERVTPLRVAPIVPDVQRIDAGCRTPDLVETLRDDLDPLMRATAAHALGRRDLANPAITRALIRGVETDPSCEVRAAIATSLGYRRETEAWRALVALARADVEPALAVAAARSLMNQKEHPEVGSIVAELRTAVAAIGDRTLRAEAERTAEYLVAPWDAASVCGGRVPPGH